MLARRGRGGEGVVVIMPHDPEGICREIERVI